MNAALSRLLRPAPSLGIVEAEALRRGLTYTEPPPRLLPPIPKVCQPDGLHVLDGEAPLLPDGSCRACHNELQMLRLLLEHRLPPKAADEFRKLQTQRWFGVDPDEFYRRRSEFRDDPRFDGVAHICGFGKRAAKAKSQRRAA